ncbi:MAG: hypothetical protein LBC73_01600 [Oscillospiraceae bacterium]|nr:hypothetical protein [Oscillospiraceae bacterium]
MKQITKILALLLCFIMCSTFVFSEENITLHDSHQIDDIKITPSDPSPPTDNQLNYKSNSDGNNGPDNSSNLDDNNVLDNNNDPDNNNTNNGVSNNDPTVDNNPGDVLINLDASDINSRGAIVMTLDGEVLFEKNADIQLRPASIGKMMIVYTVYHYISTTPDKSLSDIITISESDAQVVNYNNGGYHYGNGIYAKSNAQSNARLLAGDKLSVDDLLTLVIMPSAGDACLALARYISGTNRAFLDYMQTLAKEQIGIDMRLNSVHGGTLSTNTNSPNGGMFTTRGAALLAQALLRDFGTQVLAKTELMTFSVTVGDRTIDYRTSNPLRYEADGEPVVQGITGMKAGRLGTLPDGVTRDRNVNDSNAFANYMLTATRNEKTIIVVVMEHPWISNWTGENHGLRQDLVTLVEYGFNK